MRTTTETCDTCDCIEYQYLTSGCRVRNVIPSDLQYLTDENIQELGMRFDCAAVAAVGDHSRLLLRTGSAMTHVENMRLQAALQALQGTCTRTCTRP